jgi:NADH-quinone oxidoreductase subunit G
MKKPCELCFSITRLKISRMNDLEKAKELVKEKFTIAQVAPSVKTALGEAFGMKPGTYVGGKIAAALSELGFNRSFETDFGAELRIMEESAELKERIDRGHGPLMTSCCPSWVGICVKMYPQLIPYLSTCKSPMEMVSSLSRTYFAEKRDITDMGVVSIMPCFAKKMETKKGQTDVSLTAMEAVGWMKELGIDLNKIYTAPFDTPFGMSSSAGIIYASAGGVSEATLRTYMKLYADANFEKHLYKTEVISDGVRKITAKAGDHEVRVAMVVGVKAMGPFCKELIADIKKGESKYDLIEVMACPSGCVGGNGMPNAGQPDAIKARIASLKKYDEKADLKTAHQNSLVREIYASTIGEPFGDRAKEILHHHNFKEIFN